MCIQQAIKEGADVNKPDEKGRLPLHEMAQDREICELLLKARADPMLQDGNGNTAFFTYLSVDRWKLFQKYTQESIHEILKLRNQKGNTLFATVCHWSVCPEVFNALEYLLNEGVPRDIFNANPNILHKIHNTEIGEFLLKKGCPVNALDSDNKTALDHALEDFCLNLDFIALLLRYGAQPRPCINWNGYMDHIRYNCNGKFEIFEHHAQLIFQKADLKLFGWTYLHWAANCGLNQELENMLKAGVDEIDRPCGCTTRDMLTPLHMAARNNQTLSVFLLLEKGNADPNVKDAQDSLPKGFGWHRKYEHSIDQLLDIYRHIVPEERDEKILAWIDRNTDIASDFIKECRPNEIRSKNRFLQDAAKIREIIERKKREGDARFCRRKCEADR